MGFLQLLKDKIKGKKEIRYVKKNPLHAERKQYGSKRGVGWTRRLHEEPKYRRKMAERSRKINRRRQRRI